MPAAPAAGDTLMLREAGEAPAVVLAQLGRNADVMRDLGARLQCNRPHAIVTLARGSSDHAATFARYLIERHAGVLTSSLSPSIASIYDSTPDLAGMVALAISQSGRSPDLITAAERAQASGALLVTMVNDEQSPLATMSDIVIPLSAGPERSVAASKSFIASLAAILHLLAAWTDNLAIGRALSSLPDNLAQAFALDWTRALAPLTDVHDMYVIGRGHGFAIAQEAALKLKETCGMHAEAFSAAEVRHGPMALVHPGFPTLLFAQSDESREGIAELAASLHASGAEVIGAGLPDGPGIRLPTVQADPLIEPVLQVASFYRLANAVALARGLDPDRPPHLSKVTETR